MSRSLGKILRFANKNFVWSAELQCLQGMEKTQLGTGRSCKRGCSWSYGVFGSWHDSLEYQLSQRGQDLCNPVQQVINTFCLQEVGISSVQSLSHVWLFATPWIAAHQASLSIANPWSSIRLTFIESVMPSSHLILCFPLLLLPSIFPSIRDISNESALYIRWPKYWRFSFNISPFNEHPGLISFRMDWLFLLAGQARDSKESSPTPQFKSWTIPGWP